MQLIREINPEQFADQGCALTIGNFDAVHLGHQKMLTQLVESARQRKIPSVLMTFIPNPSDFFNRDKPSARLTTLADRFFALQDLGVDYLFVVKFDHELAKTEALDFVKTYIHHNLNAKYVLVGDDFAFGKGRRGDFDFLHQYAHQYGYDVEKFNSFRKQGVRVSSSLIRELLAKGELAAVEKYLGRKYAITGRVGHGDKRGRKLGFPTLNIPIRCVSPLNGVYAVRVQGLGKARFGVANLGSRPTFGGRHVVLEVYVFDFDETVYGRRVCISFVDKIRDELNFNGLEALKTQIHHDMVRARKIFDLPVGALS